MNYETKMAKILKENLFVNHRIEAQTGNTALQQITYKAQNTMEHNLVYTLTNNNIFVTGDFGEAVFTFPFTVTLHNLKNCSLELFYSSLNTFSKCSWHFDKETAISALKGYWEEKKVDSIYEDHDKIYEGFMFAIHCSNSVEDYNSELLPVITKTTADAQLLRVAADFGKCISPNLIAMWVGLLDIVRINEKTAINIEKVEVNTQYFKELLQYAEFSPTFIIGGDEFSDDHTDFKKVERYNDLAIALNEQGISYIKIPVTDLKSLQFGEKEAKGIEEYHARYKK
ncbi:hypothetical protein [Lysinibacillus fusiformis]|uniref:hypothetical protein n=2 Tax=Lysinibacillus fusiformis TaxID=28031 RepID=UPI000506049F|nr:hypothetical protein [Lysinibacillus fusiformis]KGA83760.1 hypothetical protein KQ41_06915 [Lysinibacillus fusiformis]UXJ71262.1 hypothetical protein N5069_23785 [Lysinibacillus fusiformis]